MGVERRFEDPGAKRSTLSPPVTPIEDRHVALVGESLQ
jgi:hypothetical protein